MDTYAVGKRLVELCAAGEHRKAIEELYADNVDVHEAMVMPKEACEQMGIPYKPNGMKTKDEVLQGSDWFMENHEIHGGNTDGPYPMGDKFVCFMSIDCTMKAGPMAGQRMEMKEACEYHVKDGKIVASHFLYPPMDCE